jgi:anti-sigma factor RsiW
MSEMACRELADTITDYLEGALAPEDVARFEAHLPNCPFCVDYLAQMRATIDRLGEVPADRLSEDARTGVLDAFREGLSP